MSTTQPIKNRSVLEKIKSYYFDKEEFRNYTLIIIGLNTALRISDILSLQWKDVYDFSNGQFRMHIHLNEQKTGKETIIAMNPSVIFALDKLSSSPIYAKEGIHAEHYLFTGRKNKETPISRFQAYRIIKEAAAFAGIEEHISCHSLRKTFGYFAWKQGVPPAMLMNIYNHSSYQITKRYLCIEQDDRDEVFMKINI